MKHNQEMQYHIHPSAALTPPVRSARFRSVVDFVGDGGIVFYMIQQKRWWGWSQINHAVLAKHAADKAIQELTAMQNAPVSDNANVNKS